MDIATESDMASLYSAESKFEMTTFPTGSMMNVHKTSKSKPKTIAPNAKQRSFKNIPRQILPDEEEDDDDPATPTAIIKPLNDYKNPSHTAMFLRWYASIFGMVSVILIV